MAIRFYMILFYKHKPIYFRLINYYNFIIEKSESRFSWLIKSYDISYITKII